jgi:hypothetical protein
MSTKTWTSSHMRQKRTRLLCVFESNADNAESGTRSENSAWLSPGNNNRSHSFYIRFVHRRNELGQITAARRTAIYVYYIKMASL